MVYFSSKYLRIRTGKGILLLEIGDTIFTHLKIIGKLLLVKKCVFSENNNKIANLNKINGLPGAYKFELTPPAQSQDIISHEIGTKGKEK